MNRSLKIYGSKRGILIAQSILLVLVNVIMVYGFYGWKQCRLERENLSQQLSLYEKTIYVAAEKLPKGTILTENLVDAQVRYSDEEQDNFISDGDFGKMLSFDIEEGTCLMDYMLCSSENNIRMFLLEGVEIPEHVQIGDRVDIRIRYGNAEEYIVLADKIVVNFQADSDMVLCLTEEELLMISSAIIDTELFRNAKLYVVEYPEYVNMQKSRINYIANQDVLLLLGRKITEGESRKKLEERLLQSKQ